MGLEFDRALDAAFIAKLEAEARRDGKGRHTTTRRELVALASGALLIDNPGMREVGLWEAEQGVNETFADVFLLTEQCRFGDCSHESEPDCAVREAIQTGTLERERLASFRTLTLDHVRRRDFGSRDRGRRRARR